MGAHYKIEFHGVDGVKRKIGRKSAGRLKGRISKSIEEGVRDMAEQAYQNAPKDTTALAQSILASVEREAPLSWYFGSTLPYAQRQEYEHKTKKAYFRRAIWQEIPVIHGRIASQVRDQFH